MKSFPGYNPRKLLTFRGVIYSESTQFLEIVGSPQKVLTFFGDYNPRKVLTFWGSVILGNYSLSGVLSSESTHLS